MKDRNIFSSKNPPTSWTRNQNTFLKSIDLSGFAVYVDNGENWTKAAKSGVLISNKHILFPQHFISNPSTPFDVKFVNNNNEVFTYTVTATTWLSGTDILIGVLNTTIDSSLCFYKILPSDFQNYYSVVLDPNGSGLEMPVVYTDQEKILSVGDAKLDRGGSSPYPWVWKVYSSLNSKKYSYSRGLISGDSGNPIFVVLNNELIILGVWLSGTGTRDASPPGKELGVLPAIHEYLSSINTIMTNLAGSSYSLTEIEKNFNQFLGLKKPSISVGSNVYSESVLSYNKSPAINGIGQSGKTVSLDDDGYVYGPFNLNYNIGLGYSINPSSPYLGSATNNLKVEINYGGSAGAFSEVVAYKALVIPAPVLNSISNTNNKRPIISGTWTQIELPSYIENLHVDIYDNNTIISSEYIYLDGVLAEIISDVMLNNVNANLSFTFAYLPTSDLSVGSHTIKAKVYYYKSSSPDINNTSSFSNSITFDILDTGGS
jgi:hypothetical protein